MRLMTLTLALTALGGCVVYDEELVYEDTGASALPERPGQGEPADPSMAPVSVVPAGALTGERALISLYATPEVDLDQIVEVTFLGDSELTVRATSNRNGSEFLLAVDVPDDAILASNHLLLGMSDGTTLFLEDAFTVAADVQQLPMSPVPPRCE